MSGTAFFAGAATQSGDLECLGMAGNCYGPWFSLMEPYGRSALFGVKFGAWEVWT